MRSNQIPASHQHLFSTRCQVNVTPVNSFSTMTSENLSVEWTLRPLILWMKFFGFQLDGNCRQLNWFGLTKIRFLGGIILLVNIILHMASFISGVERLKVNRLGQNGTNMSTANLLNMGIEHFNYTFVLIGVHNVFFAVSLTPYWKSLWNTLKIIDQSFNFKPKFYHRCRKIVKIGLSLLALDIGSYLYMSVDSFYWKLGLYWRPVAVVLSNVTRTAVLNIFALFCVLVRCTSVVFEILNHRIEILTRAASDDVDHHQQYHLMLHNPPNLFTARLEKWRRNHARACQLVDRINECFGIVLLVTVTNGFVSFITTSFELVRSLQENNSLPPIFATIFIKKLLLLGIIVYEPYQLQFNAGKTLSYLRQLQHTSTDLSTHVKLNTIILEVTQSCPKITAMEFFDVNLRLFPTLIGSTLTYVAILCQASAYANQW